MKARKKKPATAAESRRKTAKRPSARKSQTAHRTAKRAGVIKHEKTEEDRRQLIHELRVYQAELESQNEELQQARAAVDMAMEGYADLFDFAPVGYLALDRRGTIAQANLTSGRLLGCKRERLAGARFAFFVSEADRARVNDLLKQVFATRTSCSCEVELSGKVLPKLVVHIEASLASDGRHCRAVLVDVTALARGRSELKASEERHRAVLEDQTETICRFRADNTFTFVNEVFCRFFGKTSQELMGSSWQPVVVKDDLPMILERLRRLSPMNPVVVIENRVYSASGEVRWMQFVNRGFFDKAGRLVETQSVGRDVTERKLAEEALRESEERWKFALEGAGDGVWDWNVATGEVVFSNRWKSMIGYEPDEIRDHFDEWSNRVHPEDLPGAMAALKAHFKGRTDAYANEFRMRCKDGSWKWILARGMATSRDGKGRPLRMIGTHQDMTMREAAKEREAQNMKLIAEGAPCPSVLEALMQSVEAAHPGMYCTVLTVDAAGSRITEIVAPSLPAFFTKALVGCLVTLEEPCCIGQTVSTGSRAAMNDIRYGGGSGKLGKLTSRAKLRACWSEPVIGSTGLILGAIACYYREPRSPTGLEIKAVSAAASLAALAIERRHSEEALRESEERYRRIVETAVEGIWTIDAASLTDYVNPKMAQMMGYTPAEMIGRPLDDFMDEEGSALLVDILERRKRGVSEQFEFKFLRKDGTCLWAFVSTNPITDANGAYVGAIALLTDISSLKEAQMALQDREERYRGIKESELVGLMFWNLDGDITEANETFLQMVGYTQEDLMKGCLRWSALTPPEYRPADEHAIRELEVKNVITPYEKEYFRKDGTRVPIILGGAVFPHRPNEGVSFVLDITERKQAERALRESEERYRLLADNIDDIVGLNDTQGNRLYLSPSYYRKTGWSEDDLASSDWRTRLHPDDLQMVERTRMANLAGEATRIEHRVRCRDGSWIWFDTSCKPILDENGKIWRLLVWSFDITEQKKTREALRQSEDRYARAARGTNDGLWDWNIATGETYLSPRWKELLGFAEDELADSREAAFIARLHPDDRSRVAEVRRAHLEDHVPYDVEARLRTKAGEYRWFRVRGEAEWNAEGQAVRMAGAISDITERKEVVDALRESEQRFRAIFEQAAVGVAVVDVNTGRYVRANQRFCDLAGLTQEQMTAATFQSITHPDDVAASVEGNEKLREGTIGRLRQEKRFLRPDGSVIWVNIAVSPLWKAGEQPSFNITIAEDITARKSAEAALTESEERYARAVRGTTDGLWDWFIPTGELYLSPRWKEMLGYLDHELPNHVDTLFTLLHPDDRARVDEAVHAHLDRREAYDIEFRLRTKSGGYRWVRSRAEVERDTDDRATHMAGTISDVTERVLAQEHYARELDFNKALVSHTSALIVVLDEFSRIVHVNEAFERALGYGLADIGGAPLWESDMMDEAEIPRAKERYRQLAAGEKPSPVEIHLRARDGETHILELHPTATYHPDRSIDRIILTFTDLTERIRLQQELLKISEQEQASIGHNLHDGVGQTMTGIATMLEHLEGALDGENRKLAARIRELMQQSVAEVRRMSHGLSPVAIQLRGLAGGLQLLAETIRTNFRASSVCEIDPAIVIGSTEKETHLFRIAQEAVNNALRHGKAREIGIFLRRISPGECELRISDNGAGMKSKQAASPGVGLRVMKYRMSLIGGEISVTRRSPKGVNIACRFPCPETTAPKKNRRGKSA